MSIQIQVRLNKNFISTATHMQLRGHVITAHELFRDMFVYANLPNVSIRIQPSFQGDIYLLSTEPAKDQTATDHLIAIHRMKAQLESFGCDVTVE